VTLSRFACLGIALGGVGLLAGARNAPPPPRLTMPAESTRSFTIRGEGLTIQPGEKSTYLRFAGPVVVTGPDFSLSADVVELDIASSGLTSGAAVKLPKLPKGAEHAAQDPGAAAAAMAKELRLPEARFSASAIQRMGATGSVRVGAKGIQLAAPTLVSNDGGSTWAAIGRTTLERVDKTTGERYELAADSLVYDRQNLRAAAKGKVVGVFRHANDTPVEVSAEHCEMDFRTQRMQIPAPLSVKYGSLVLTSGSLDADVGERVMKATGTAEVQDTAHGLSMHAGSLVADLKARTIRATGGAEVSDTQRGVVLTAATFDLDLDRREVIASGNPVLRRGESVYSGKRILMREESGKTVIEVDGPQNLHLNLEDLPGSLPPQRGARTK